MTNICARRDRSVVTSSVIPSAKYCWSRSLLRLVNGSTTIDRRGATADWEIELLALTRELLEVPAELVATGLDLELQDGTVIADGVDGRRCVFLAGLYRD